MPETSPIAGGLLLIAIAFLYLLPAFIAYGREHHQKVPILLVTLLLGWTALGWIAALIWSVTATRPSDRSEPPQAAQPPQPEFVPRSHRSEPETESPTVETSETKTCPYCAETIKAAAIVCRYCGRDVPAINIDDLVVPD